MIRALGPLAETGRDMLPMELRGYVARAIANAGLDSPYRLVDLTAEQRGEITALQQQRDRVIKDARHHRPGKSSHEPQQDRFQTGTLSHPPPGPPSVDEKDGHDDQKDE